MKCRSDNPVFVKLLIPLPEDQLVSGEIELLQAHFAGFIDRVFLPEDGSEDKALGKVPAQTGT